MTVLYCVRPEHNDQKPESPNLFKDLKKYLKGMPKMDEKSLCFANFGYVSLNSMSINASSKSRKPCDDAKVPRVNPETGEIESVEDPSHHDRPNDSCFLMVSLIV